jgi:hypothetical protein
VVMSQVGRLRLKLAPAGLTPGAVPPPHSLPGMAPPFSAAARSQSPALGTQASVTCSI